MTRRATILAATAVCLMAGGSIQPSHAQTVPCAVIGDSISLGVSPVLPCAVNAKGGIPSGAVIARVDPTVVNVVSAGSNDPRNHNLASNLLQIRQRAKSVIWIVPVHSRAARLVRAAAKGAADPVVTFKPGRDGVHPRSYRALADAIRPYLNAGAK